MWDLATVTTPSEDATESSKRRKTDSGKATSTAPVETEAPLLVLEGHSQAVSCLAWPHPAAVYSGSWDASIRMWDTSVGTCTNHYLGNKVMRTSMPHLCEVPSLN
jgi:WD40 repeat protein